MTKRNYEEEMKKLEGIVAQLEAGKLDLEEALRLFEEGVRLSAECTRMLESAQGRIEMLIEHGGGLETVELNGEAFDESEEL